MSVSSHSAAVKLTCLPDALEAQHSSLKCSECCQDWAAAKYSKTLYASSLCPLLSANYPLLCRSLFFWYQELRFISLELKGLLSVYLFTLKKITKNNFFIFFLLKPHKKKSLASSRQTMKREIRGECKHKQVLREKKHNYCKLIEANLWISN